jgi:hypothetical protein
MSWAIVPVCTECSTGLSCSVFTTHRSTPQLVRVVLVRLIRACTGPTRISTAWPRRRARPAAATDFRFTLAGVLQTRIRYSPVVTGVQLARSHGL